MPLRSKQRLVLVKTEGGTYGTDSSPTGSNALFILEPKDLSHHVPAPKPLSTAAQAVMDAANAASSRGPEDCLNDAREIAAAALRAAADQVVPEPQKADNDDALIDSLYFSTRTKNALKRCKVLTVGDLRYFTYSDLLLINGFGVASADEVVTSLASIGISLSDSAQARSLSWSDVVVRRATRAKLLAIAAELEGHHG